MKVKQLEFTFIPFRIKWDDWIKFLDTFEYPKKRKKH